VKKRTLPETSQLFQSSLHSRDFDRGRKLFGAANCFACHRFDNEGGAHGPDLTGLAGRFSLRDLLESIIDPSKVISDQYAGVIIQTVDGRAIAGRIVNLNQDSIMVMTNMLDPNAVQNIQRKDIESMGPASKSLMPDGLLDTLQDDEVLDLMAFLLSRGDRNHAMFRGK
jgi:putative heme-binding domain-containing protein